jgi:hypothetical protein
MSSALAHRLLACLLLAAIALAPRTALATEDNESCSHVIATLPATVDAPGTWCLSGDLTTSMSSGQAINVTSDNATLDCNGFRLDDSAQESGAMGFRIEGRRNVVVRNCTVRGFHYGVYIDDLDVPANGGHLVEDNNFIQSHYVGIYLDGAGSTIRRNRVVESRGHTPTGAMFAIVTYGTVDIVDNTVQDVQSYGAAAAGMLVNGNVGGSVRGNRVSLVKVATGSGLNLGIRTQNNSSRVNLRGNVLIGEGIPGSTGLSCESANHVAKSNSISGFDTALGCTDNGNLVKP